MWRLRRGAGCRGCLGTSRLTPQLLLLSAASWDKFYALEIKVLNVLCFQLPSLVSLFIFWSPAASWTLRCSSKSTLPACYSDSLKTAPVINNLDRLVTLIQHSVSRCGRGCRGHMRYTYIILGHLARRQLRYCEGHVCLKMDLSGLKSEQEP